MNLITAKAKFFKANPDTLAHFCKNEKLNKYLCFTYDYCLSSDQVAIPASQILEIEAFAQRKDDDAMFIVIDYVANKTNDREMVNKLSDFYYNEAVVNENTYSSVRDVCNAFNEYCQKSGSKTANTSTQSQVACYIVNEDSTLDENRIFTMSLTRGKSKNGAKYCKIENTFTEDDYKGNGIHSYGIKFLEAVLARKHIYSLIGESQECDVYDSSNGSTLAEHYAKLGFQITTDAFGTNNIYKAIDPDFYMEISASDLEKAK